MKKMLLVAMMTMIVILMSCTMCWAAEPTILNVEWSVGSELAYLSYPTFVGYADNRIHLQETCRTLSMGLAQEVFGCPVEKWYNQVKKLTSPHWVNAIIIDTSGRRIAKFCFSVDYGEEFVLVAPTENQGYRLSLATIEFEDRNYLKVESSSRVTGRGGIKDVTAYFYYRRIILPDTRLSEVRVAPDFPNEPSGAVSVADGCDSCLTYDALFANPNSMTSEQRLEVLKEAHYTGEPIVNCECNQCRAAYKILCDLTWEAGQVGEDAMNFAGALEHGA